MSLSRNNLTIMVVPRPLSVSTGLENFGLGLSLGLEGSGLGLGLEGSGLVNIPDFQSMLNKSRAIAMPL